MEAEAERSRILSELSDSIEFVSRQSKPKIGGLSPGCRICGEGGWSCLFINGKCNCKCFYCPTAQNEIGVPTTNRVPFGKALDYADYVKMFGFKGVSISGGEPLVSFKRTLQYVETVRKKVGDGLHIWLYTNGTLLTETIVKQLRDAGLNEIRFDISAHDYDLNKIKSAVGEIPKVTIEIPAIPEDFERVGGLLATLGDMGVDHLNLHQLRLTPHNAQHLMGRNYTFLHGEKVTVLESELMALQLLKKSLDENIGLPVNYCSFVYKHRFQRAAARSRNAAYILKGHESVTESGFIRSVSIVGEPSLIIRQVQHLRQLDTNPQCWLLSGRQDRMSFHPDLWQRIDFGGCEVRIRYSEAVLCASISYRHVFKEIAVNTGKKLYVERQPRSIDICLTNEQKENFENLFIYSQNPFPVLVPAGLDQIMDFECIPSGLQPYF